MGLLDALASVFINTFGITQPSESMRRRAAWFIFGMLCLTVVIVVVGGTVLYHLLRK
jgi:hypothetical protein